MTLLKGATGATCDKKLKTEKVETFSMEKSCRVCCSIGKLSNRSGSISAEASVATMIVPAPLSPVKLE